jgi:hypothetical protein
MTSTQLFAEAVDPYSQRFSPPGAIYAPYGWGPDFNIGMPFNYTHHLDYVREPVPVAVRRAQARGVRLGTQPIGPMYDTLSGSWSGSAPASEDFLAGILAVL